MTLLRAYWKIVAVALVVLGGAGFFIVENGLRDSVEREWVSVNEEVKALLEQSASFSATVAPAVSSDPAPESPAAPDVSQAGLVNLNTASAMRLTDLPGIGPAKAAAIIAYREQHGGFRTPEELMQVKGIGEKTYERLKHLILAAP